MCLFIDSIIQYCVKKKNQARIEAKWLKYSTCVHNWMVKIWYVVEYDSVCMYGLKNNTVTIEPTVTSQTYTCVQYALSWNVYE